MFKKMANLKIAIVALVRGYPNRKHLYESLIKRNNSIYKNINKFRNNKADIILFHEDYLEIPAFLYHSSAFLRS